MSSLKEKHDELLKNKPPHAEHNSEECAFCNESISKNTTTEGGDMKTYTEEEFTTAVKEAVAPLQAAAEAKVSELQAKLEVFEGAKADEEVAGQIAEVQSKLDNAELRASSAETKYDELVAYLESIHAEEAAKAALEARKTEVRELVKEAAGFRDEYIEENLDRWAAMSEDQFTAVLDDYRAAKAEVKPEEKASEETEEVIAETAMSHVRTNDISSEAGSLARTVFGARAAGVDVRKF
jgi:hypothetical protein